MQVEDRPAKPVGWAYTKQDLEEKKLLLSQVEKSAARILLSENAQQVQ